jgi:serine/threonine protein kinase
MSASLPALGSVVAEKYRIESLLGQGGMGAVFRAHHELLDKRVALKWLHPGMAQNKEVQERFVREARAAARIRHPNVVQVFDVGVHDGELFLVMELLEGASFEDLLSRGSMPLARALALLTDAMRGAAAAHECGIVHRDIKPENIVVVSDASHPEGLAKLLDFGISKLHDEGPGARNITKTGLAMGTPEYMSMEQLQGAKDVDLRTDIYSFGVVLYRTLTGVSPFEADTLADVVVKIATYRPPAPSQLRPELSEGLSRVVMKAMAYDRAERYANMEELIQALLGASVEPRAATNLKPRQQAPTRPSLARPRTRALSPFRSAVALGALLVGTFVLAWWQKASEPAGSGSHGAGSEQPRLASEEKPGSIAPAASDSRLANPSDAREATQRTVTEDAGAVRASRAEASEHPGEARTSLARLPARAAIQPPGAEPAQPARDPFRPNVAIRPPVPAAPAGTSDAARSGPVAKKPGRSGTLRPSDF